MPIRKFLFLLPCILGAAGLFLARRAGDGSPGFYIATVITAAIYAVAWWLWGSHDAFAGEHRLNEIVRGFLIGAVLAAVFVTGALVVNHIPFLAEPVAQLLSTTARGGLALTLLVVVLNGVAEELVYRDVVPRQLKLQGLVHGAIPIGVVSVALYCLVSVAMGVPLLILAAAVIGAVAHVEAVRSGRLLSPIAIHLTWSTGMLLILPQFIQ